MKARVILGASGLLLLLTAPLGARDRLTIRVSPTISFAPANLVVRTTVTADEANRGIEIVTESEDFYRSSEIPLDGERAPRATTFEFRSLPSGTYDITATLLDESHKPLGTVQQEVNVIDNGWGK